MAKTDIKPKPFPPSERVSLTQSIPAATRRLHDMNCIAYGIAVHQCDDDRDLEFGGLMSGLRTLSFHRHRFENAAARRRFVKWIQKGDDCAKAWTLARFG